LRGAADAAESNAKSPYNAAIPEIVPAKARSNKFSATAIELKTIMGFLEWNLSVKRPQTIAAGILMALNSVVASPISIVVPPRSRIYSWTRVLIGPVAMLIGKIA
jgi:hypothetical protein